MIKNVHQEFSIKNTPINEPKELETMLNEMAKAGWELYTIHECEIDNQPQYSCIFVREVETIEEEESLIDFANFKTQMEKMMLQKEPPYDVCLNLQRKIMEKKEKIEDIKNFLDTAKDDERSVLNEEMSKEMDNLNELKRQLRNILSPTKMTEDLGEERLSISLSEELKGLNDYSNPSNLLAQSVKIRGELTKELGYILPKINFEENTNLESNEFTINIHAVPIVKAYAYDDYCMYFQDELNLKKYPKHSVRDTDIITKRKIVWIEKSQTKDFWAKGLSASEYIMRALKYFAIRYVGEIFNYNDINRYIEIVNKNNSFLVDSILGEFISVSELKYIFSQLIREKISDKDIIYIFEKINDFSDDTSKIDLLDKLRISLSRQISYSLADENKEIAVFEIGEKTIEILEKETAEEEDGIVRLESAKFAKFIEKVARLSVEQDVILLAPQHLRHLIFILISQIFMDVPVIAPEEIASEYNIKILGTV
jgi:flagellar biosynthesis protein FlhA